ncbi:MAG TPA: tRNA pseudouridine(55) synthase TruB [Candidatus Binatia bacterium]|nr:tRNA pseudouridine(55) synthase TruB [Candidatus Binatia bacterium]
MLVIDKAPGLTSHDVVNVVRRRLGVRRVGHAGTLDPQAVGVLPILIGEATKLMAYLAGQDKEYIATIRLGIRTDTHDLDGRILTEQPVPPVSAADVERATRAFIGLIRQRPPMYSAVHHGGRRLYELAREGRQVDREPREVMVHAIAVEAVDLPRVRLRIVCGKGAYVRVLAADLGEALGVGAAVEALVRTRVGPYTLGDATPVPALESLGPEAVRSRIRPPESALAGWPVVRLGPRDAAAFRHGQAVVLPARVAGEGTAVAVHELGGGPLVGVGEVTSGGLAVKPTRILHADHPGPRILPA